MAKNPDKLAASLESENTGGVLSGLLAEEDEFDRRALWRLGSWAVGAVAAVTIAMLANQSSIGWRREQVASTDLIRQSQQLQTVAKESQNEARRLASAIDTLNSDRDRLYSRISVLEQGLDSVTGALTKQNGAASSTPAAVPAATAPPATASASAAAPAEAQKPPPALTVSPVATVAPSSAPPPTSSPAPSVAATTPEKPAIAATAEKTPVAATVPDPTPATVSSLSLAKTNPPAPSNPAPLMASKSMIGPPDPAAGKLIEPSPPSKATSAIAAPAPPAPKPEVVASAPPAAANEEPEAAEAS